MMPRIRPVRVATSPAARRSPRRHQAMARISRPPSRGAPGSRLKKPIRMLTAASQRAAVATTLPSPIHQARQPNTVPMDRLAAGPATATAASARGLGLAPPSCVTPPRNQRVIRSTLMPWCRATTAWASSWAMTVVRKTADATAPTSQ
jgi:hypothetical protein